MLLFFGDVDQLKLINDTLGHAQGDMALKGITSILKECFREADIMARIGGDEFVVLTTDDSRDSDEIIIKRIEAALIAFNQQPDKTYTLTLSLGVAHYDPSSPSTLDELLAKADSQMYLQKQSRHAKKAV
jgi:diguanylate cyclase (GGDEF)-like protein